jgi:hypothetical protein
MPRILHDVDLGVNPISMKDIFKFNKLIWRYSCIEKPMAKLFPYCCWVSEIFNSPVKDMTPFFNSCIFL